MKLNTVRFAQVIITVYKKLIPLNIDISYLYTNMYILNNLEYVLTELRPQYLVDSGVFVDQLSVASHMIKGGGVREPGFYLTPQTIHSVAL